MANRVALVTGSGRRRVGWFVARALAEAGHAIAVHYHTAAAEAQAAAKEYAALGVEAVPMAADLTDEQAARKLVDDCLARFGRIDVLVNCAAIWQRKKLEDVTADDVRRHFEANTLATFLTCQQAGLAMCRQTEGGAIVNLADWAIERPYLDYAAYFPSKGAIPTLTRSLAVELAARNPRVRVNCILPGPVMLPPDMSAAERAEAIAGTLLKREGSPESIAQAVLQLVHNDFITGACLTVDGGRTVQS